MGRTGGANQTLLSRSRATYHSMHRHHTSIRQLPRAPKLSAATRFIKAFSPPENRPDLPRQFRLRCAIVVFQRLRPERHQTIGPDSPSDWLVMKAPGSFWQTQDFRYQAMAWTSNTDLFSAEANGRLDLSSRMTVLAGFSWFQLNDTLVGTLTPTEHVADMEEDCCYSDDIFLITRGGPGDVTPLLDYEHDEQPLWRSNRR